VNTNKKKSPNYHWERFIGRKKINQKEEVWWIAKEEEEAQQTQRRRVI
jgi:hypothetical protein